MTTQELSAKKTLLTSLLKCPHRNLEETIPTFSTALDKDPLFTGKCLYALCLSEYNQIRDLTEAAIYFLLTSPFPQHREAGRVCLQQLEPYRVARVGKFARSQKPNRQVRGALTDYLSALEINKDRFDGATKVAGRQLHDLYALFHIKPSPRAQTILFDGKVPEGEFDVKKALREAATPEEQALIIIDHRVPYRLATSMLKGLTPAIWVALIEVMTPVEAINARSRIEKSGILSDPKIRKLYEDKIRKSATSARLGVTTLRERKSTKGTDKRVQAIVEEVKEKKVAAGQRITVDTLLAVDISGSMMEAIEIAKRLGTIIAPICDAELRVVCFNDTAYPLVIKGPDIKDWEDAFEMIRADGATSLGVALQHVLQAGFQPEQAIYITDQGENRHPQLHDVYSRMPVRDIRFIFINCAAEYEVAKSLQQAGAEVSEFDATSFKVGEKGWFYGLENVVPLLTKGGYLELVQKIMALELPRRQN